MPPRRAPLRCAILASAAALFGCSSGPQLHLTVQPPDDLNEHRPCYLLVRTVDSKTYLEEPYQSVASRVMQPDDSVVQSELLFPGKKMQLTLLRPAKGTLAVYVLFTAPSGEWKLLLPESGDQFELKLDASRLKRPAGE